MANWTVVVGELGKVAHVEGYAYEARREGLALMFEWGCKIHLTVEDLKDLGTGYLYGEPTNGGHPTFESPAGRAIFWQKFEELDGIFEARIKLPARELVPATGENVILPMLRGLINEPAADQIARTNEWIREQNKKGEFGTLRITRDMGFACLWPDAEKRGHYERNLKGPAVDLIRSGGQILSNSPGIVATEILNEIFYQLEAGILRNQSKERLYFYRDEKDHSGAAHHAEWSYEELRSLLVKSAFDEATMLSFCDLQARPLWIGWRDQCKEL